MSIQLAFLDAAPVRKGGMATVVFAGSVGTIIEWYDFFIYGTAAALVFNTLFFPNIDPLTGTLASLATFSVGFIARPIGGAIFGHFGDRIGRKVMRRRKRSGRSDASNAPFLPSTGSAIRRCDGARTPASTRARRATRSPGRCSFIVSEKSATDLSKINDTGLPASIWPSRPSSSGILSILGAPLTSCVLAARSSATSCSPTSPRSAGSISPSMATMSGRQSLSNRTFGPSEIRAQHSSTWLRVRFGTDSAMTPGWPPGTPT
jgi:hypothetical protein